VSLWIVVVLVVIAVVAAAYRIGWGVGYGDGYADQPSATKREEELQSRVDSLRGVVWESAYRWYREVVALNKAQRRLRRRLKASPVRSPHTPQRDPT
jgi:hypothetical protein